MAKQRAAQVELVDGLGNSVDYGEQSDLFEFFFEVFF